MAEEVPQRRSLVGRLQRLEAPDEEAIRDVARVAGFDDSRQGAVPETSSPDATPSRARRVRQSTRRDQPFTTRLTRECYESIYEEANGRNIPVAQVLEEAMDALAKRSGGRG